MTVILPDYTLIPAPRAADGHTIAHPSWCSPRDCTTTPDTADELLVTHRHVVFDEPLDAVPAGGRLVVDVVRGDICCAHGGEVLAQDATAVRIHGIDADTEIAPAQAGRLGVAVAQAAELAGGDR